jgi:hypothetical protein
MTKDSRERGSRFDSSGAARAYLVTLGPPLTG